jgi:hypothetical protein
MTMPFYVSPEQVMKDKADYARKGIARGRSVLVLAYAAGMTAGSLTLVPGGLGVIDGALVVGLLAAGTATAPAIAAVVLYRLLSLGLVGGLGWVLYLVDRRTGPVPGHRGGLSPASSAQDGTGRP